MEVRAVHLVASLTGCAVVQQVTGTPDDPFGGQKVDANALGWALAVGLPPPSSEPLSLLSARPPYAARPLHLPCHGPRSPGWPADFNSGPRALLTPRDSGGHKPCIPHQGARSPRLNAAVSPKTLPSCVSLLPRCRRQTLFLLPLPPRYPSGVALPDMHRHRLAPLSCPFPHLLPTPLCFVICRYPFCPRGGVWRLLLSSTTCPQADRHVQPLV